MAKRKPIPKSQREISEEQHVAYDRAAGNPNSADDTYNRGTKQSWSGDNVKPFSVGIQDIDESIFYYFENVIKPTVIQNGERLPVPVIYGSPEKWKSMQKDGYYRDLKGKIMAPLIMFKRNTITKNRSIANKLDANQPNLFTVSSKRYDKGNTYDNFNVLNNRTPQKQFYASAVPDYVTVTYSCTLFTYYVEQLNGLVEAIQYASDAYWGNPERYQFKAMIDSFAFQTEMQTSNERIVRSTFDIVLNGYIIPEVIQRDLNGIKKYNEKTKLIFSLETEMIPDFYDGVVTRDRVVTDGDTRQILESQFQPSPDPTQFNNEFDNSFA